MAIPSGKPKFAYYTRSKFNALSTKDISTFYVVEETDGKRRMYLGEHLLTEGYLTAHQSLANYVTTNTTQTISGVKTFSGATTTVKRLIATNSGSSTHGVISRGSRANMLYDNVGVTGGLASALVDVDITNGNNQTTRVAKIGIYGSGTGGADGAPSATYLWLSSVLGNTYNVSPTLKIDSQDRVGIAIAGTGRPTQALDVAGKIRMRTQTAAGDGNDIVTTKKYVDDKISNIELTPGPQGPQGAIGYSIRYYSFGASTGTQNLDKTRISNDSTLQVGDLVISSNGNLYEVTNISSTNVTAVYKYSIIGEKGEKGDEGLPGYELLKDRADTEPLTTVSSGGYVTLNKAIERGDTLLVEINHTSSYAYNPKIVQFTVGAITSGTSEYNSVTFDMWTGTLHKIYSTFPYFNSTYSNRLYFSNNRYFSGTYSGSTITYNTGTGTTLYVGRVWRLNR